MQIRPEAITSQTDSEFWGNGQPEKIVIATASLRKALMIHWWMENFAFKLPDFQDWSEAMGQISADMLPIEYQRLIEAEIQNGDGTLQQARSLGYLHGVEVVVESQQGEGPDNSDPVAQSRNKITSVLLLPEYQEKDVIVIASDTVGLVNGQHLGKPRNDSNFPDLESLGREEFEKRLPYFKIWYLLNYYDSAKMPDFEAWYPIVTELKLEASQIQSLFVVLPAPETDKLHDKHVNALVTRRGDHEKVIKTELEFEIPSREELMFLVKVFLESGGGGVTQQLINWTISVIDQIADDYMRSVFERIPEEQRAWYLIFHLMGVPVWAFTATLTELQSDSSQSYEV